MTKRGKISHCCSFTLVTEGGLCMSTPCFLLYVQVVKVSPGDFSEPFIHPPFFTVTS